MGTNTTNGVDKAAQDMTVKANKFVDQAVVPTCITTAGAATYTAAQVLGGIIWRDPAGAGRTDVLPTAALLVAAMIEEQVGDCIDVLVVNEADENETITLSAGTGGAFDQLAATRIIPQNTSRLVRIVLTNVTAGSEAYKVYM